MNNYIIILLIGYPVFAGLINVPFDKTHIQEAINVATDGDTILVHPNIYNESIRFNGKNIIVSSLYMTSLDTSYISKTIIDGSNLYNSCVKFVDGENEKAVLCGFTICNGEGSEVPHLHDDFPTPRGGGIFIFESSPSLHHLKIINNKASQGGGIFLYKSNSNVKAVNIISNKASAGGGGGISCQEATPSFFDISICKNSVNDGGGGGMVLFNSDVAIDRSIISGNIVSRRDAGIACSYLSRILLRNMTIAYNHADRGSSVIGAYYNSHIYLINSIVWENEFPVMAADNSITKSSVNIIHSNIAGGKDGGIVGEGEIHWFGENISVNPMFKNSNTLDFSLQKQSPCIDNGTSFFMIGADTLINMDSNDYFGANPDMGAVEFDPSTSIANKLSSNMNIKLYPNYPNPVNNSSNIRFFLPYDSIVRLGLYNCLGKEVKLLLSSEMNAGVYEIQFQTDDLNSGVYFIKLTTERCHLVNKCTIVK